LTLRNCTLVSKVSGRSLSFNQVHFIDCTFEVKQQLMNYQQWIRASPLVSRTSRSNSRILEKRERGRSSLSSLKKGDIPVTQRRLKRFPPE
jgi:hypothetical protein